MNPGDTIMAKGPIKRLTYLGYGQMIRHAKTADIFTRKKIGGIAGGTGIAPIYPIIMHGLKYEDGVEFSLIFGNKTSKDILLQDELTELALENRENGKFKLHLLVDKDPHPAAGPY